MRYLLDTNICIYIIKKKPSSVLDHLEMLQPSDVTISSITLAELEYGIAKSTRPEQNREALSGFLTPFDILPFDEQAAYHYGEVRKDLEAKGQVIGSMDMMIAAHARSLGFPVVTNNEKEFKRVPGLIVENWV
jgi:tRNA(fMet)-specific endonuclease VapC